MDACSKVFPDHKRILYHIPALKSNNKTPTQPVTENRRDAICTFILVHRKAWNEKYGSKMGLNICQEAKYTKTLSICPFCSLNKREDYAQTVYEDQIVLFRSGESLDKYK